MTITAEPIAEQANKGRTKLERWGILFIILAFLLLAFGYSIINPLHEATDELRHYRFLRILADTGRLPVQGQEPCRSQSHHPPLYYALGAITTAWIDTGSDSCYTPPQNPFWAYRYWEVGTDNKNQFLHGPEESFPWYGMALAAHIARAINVLLGAGVVWFTWATGRAIWPGRPALALGAAALVAFNPMFLYLSGAMNNDVIAALAGAAITFACVRLLRDPGGLNWRWGLILGLLYGLALLSKFNLAVIILLIEAAMTWVAWRRNQWRQWLAANVIILLTATLLAGWWFVRNQLLYGEPTGFQELTELWGVRNPLDSFGLALSELPYAWTTLWGRFGFGQIPLPLPLYQLIFVATIIGFLGMIVGFVHSSSSDERILLLLLNGNVLLFFLVLFNYMLVSPAGPNGRFFFPALSALALLIFYGLSNWPALLVSGRRRSAGHQLPDSLLATVGIAAMLLLSLVALFGYLSPAYARPPELSASAEIPNRTGAQFDSLVTLLGYDLSTTAVVPGEWIDIDLYWEVNARPPGNYLLFVHLLDEVNTMVAQRDTHPGLGNYPSNQWQPGDRFVESIRLYVPETAYAPVEAKLNVGLYAPGAYRLAVTGQDGQDLGDGLTLATIQLLPREGAYPNAQDQNFNDEIRLLGYQYDRRTAAPGETIDLTLFWQALQDLSADYIVQVRMIDENGKIWTSADSRPAGGDLPTNAWQEGQNVEDSHRLFIEPATPAAAYLIDIALLDAETNRRQNIVGEDGHWIDAHLVIAQVRVLPE